MPNLELISLPDVCVMFGNLHRASIYRLTRRGLIPQPIHIGSSSRWLRQECEAALALMIGGRS
jgi:predicted DNA-binding transcriptional regulator AlpA